MRFADTQLLWLLAGLIPALLGFFVWAWKKRQKLLTQFIQARLLPGLISGASPVRQKIRMGCIIVAVICLIFALARPQWGFTIEESKQIGMDIVVAVDTSKSMLAQDIAPNRLERAKLAALDLMQQAKSDRLGLVAFAGDAFLQCPLTIDDTAFRQSVQALNVNTISRGGTSLTSAINTALAAFKEGDNYKVLVLFTDGEDNDQGDAIALESARAAAADGLIIFTVGVGTAEGEILTVPDGNGGSEYVRDLQGNVVKSHLNESLLKQIAAATKGGFYLPLRGAGTMDALYTKGIGPLPKSEQGTRTTRQYNEHYQWPLGAAMVLLLFEMLLPERRRNRARADAPAAALRGAATVALLLISVRAVQASPAAAQKDYQSGNYDAALKEYQQALEKKSDDATLHYDAGVSAYRDKQYNEAAKQFDRATGAQDLKLQEGAYYNLGNALFRSGEENQDQEKRKQSWQDSVKEFQNTLAINPGDIDAKHNLEFVKKKLEELKQQQQQQNQQNQQNQNQDQNQKQNQQQQSKNQQQNQQQQQQNQQSQQQQNQQNQQSQQNQSQQQSQSQQNQQQSQAQQNQQQQNQNQQGQQNQQQQAQQQAEQQQAQQDQSQQNQQGQEKQDQAAVEAQKQEEQQAAEAQREGRMTPQEARRLLDAQKGDEQILQWNAQNQKPEDNSRPIKDW